MVWIQLRGLHDSIPSEVTLENTEEEHPKNDPLEIDNGLRPHGAPSRCGCGRHGRRILKRKRGVRAGLHKKGCYWLSFHVSSEPS